MISLSSDNTNPLRNATETKASLTDEVQEHVSMGHILSQIEKEICKDEAIKRFVSIGMMNGRAFPSDVTKALINILKEVSYQGCEKEEAQIVRQTFDVIVSALQFLPDIERKKIIGSLVGLIIVLLQ